MKCPTCSKEDLQPAEIEKGLIGAGCQNCHGVLISLIQYRYWLDHFQPSDDQIITEQGNNLAIDSKGAKLCPKCSKLMTKFKIDASSENRIELCGHCDEAWLDGGEWQLLKQLDMQDHLPELFTDAWQKKIRAERQHAHWQKHYTELLGEDAFAKVDAFKQWLDQHPKSSEIKHYLTTNFDV
ncbi:hypothetical protein TDB9533_04730 [Thalassocella blandensis]|nr:hypothetical protein TDB9533_04730 [Thalassocella blandensis]